MIEKEMENKMGLKKDEYKQRVNFKGDAK